ncbi:DotU family type IV/VI secretion system protein, partial [bacterium]|nr:DotU family type IV/VI secretion system protein [bacterium]
MHMTDCFMELVAYVTHFLRTAAVRQSPYPEVRREIDLLLAAGESLVKRERFSRDDFDSARFAVCAWVDEAVLSSAWSEKSLW